MSGEIIGVATGIAEVLLAFIAVALEWGGRKDRKRWQEETAREQRKSEDDTREAVLLKSKLTRYQRMLAYPDARPLQALGELELEELESDQSIRSAIEHFSNVSRTDPWEGKAAAVKDVNLVRFFSHVTTHEINLADADLTALAQQVRALGGARYAIDLYRRRSRMQLAGGRLALLAFLALVLLGRVINTGPRLSTQPEPTSDSSIDHGDQPQGPNLDEQGQDTASYPDSSRLQEIDSQAVRDSQWDQYITMEVTTARNVMRTAHDSITKGNYVFAFNTLRQTRSTMERLQSRLGGSSPELRDIIGDLNLKIDSTATGCQEEAAIEERRGGKVPVCP